MGEAGESGRGGLPAGIPGRTLAVLYGTETGSAEDIAVELGRMTERLHFQTRVDEMDSFKLADLLRVSLVIFVTSTRGQGDMPKNTLRFWKNLRREKLNNTNCLASLRFAIFGLGDSSYLKFNWAARKLRARLLQLGASEFFRAGEGDERHDNGIDSIYLPWYQDLKATLLTDYPLPEATQPIPDDVQLPPKYALEPLTTAMDVDAAQDCGSDVPQLSEDERRFLALRTQSAARSHVDNPMTAAERALDDQDRLSISFPADVARRDNVWERSTGLRVDVLDRDNVLKDYPAKYSLEGPSPRAKSTPPADLLPIPGAWFATLEENYRVTPAGHWQDVRHLTFSVPMTEAQWLQICDRRGHLTIVIWPKNFPEDVEELISQMGWESVADTPFQLKGRAPPGLFVKGGVATLRQLLTHNLDITAVPKRSFIRDLVFYTEDEREKERLQELTAPGNEQEFYDYTCRPRRTILELLRDFGGVKIPAERVLDLFPVIRGREYSVCNGSTTYKNPGEVGIFYLEILAAIVEYKTIIRKPRQGLCSRYLKHLAPGTPLRICVKPASDPYLVPNELWAQRPLIAIATGTGIAPIRAIIQERSGHRDSGDTVLFFGCRNRAADFYFEQEWAEYGNLTVHAAFSRDNVLPDPASTTHATEIAHSEATREGGSDREPALPALISAPPPVEYDAGKNYVQHLIRKHAAEIGALAGRQPIICICGNAGRMPVSVRAALVDALVMCEVVSTRDEADRWLANPENVTMWQETW